MDPIASSLLSLSDDVLLSEIFPKLPYDIILKLCSMHSRFNEICHSENLWKRKTQQDFPDLSGHKPSDHLWRDYYRFILTSKIIPLYYQGDRLAYLPFNPNNLNLTLSLMAPYLNRLTASASPETVVNLVFIDAQLNPIIVIKYQRQPLQVDIEPKSLNYSSVVKALFFVDNEFDKPQLPGGMRGTGLGRTPLQPMEEKNKVIIRRELTSRFGHPPIYGQINDGRLYIYDHRVIITMGPMACRNLVFDALAEILWEFNKEVFPDRNTYIQEMAMTGVNKNKICQSIHQRLTEIGHMI